MKSVAVLLVVVWLLVGGFAAFQRGDFDDGNCSTITDNAMAVVLGPINYTAFDLIGGGCSYPDAVGGSRRG